MMTGFETRPEDGGLAGEWSWIRGNEGDWRVGEDGRLLIRIRPGTIYGEENTARNLLVRPLPEDADAVQANVEIRLKLPFEQAGLLWYYDDDHYIKLVFELLPEGRHVVLVREEGAVASVAAKAAVDTDRVALRLALAGDGQAVEASCRQSEAEDWTAIGRCPAFGRGTEGLQAGVFGHCGSDEEEHWAAFGGFEVSREAVR
ncbi:beta-xylosidase family glycoside hydrolase [Paenibacillus arenilitoris]|uniref:DUF1349 domain-containing protein n=1 Tax=Paenibacillus arenilitoris TaxID=2772299 RepID=A0A927H719_9BACL|nr:DUF1349 domain-containing protein [Paenibacillus arenilitoris]MBD2870575.1 DUF1349 domain-containing protein [Paenibacillus arenilitoris]